MSGICGVFNLDGAPVRPEDLAAMTATLERRGPDRTAHWCDGPVGFGHTLLTTTLGLAREPQPVAHHESGCVITADVRLDNRDELLAALGLKHRAEEIGDAGLIVEAYLKWDDKCPDRLLGDFAFVIWDPRWQRLFGARDPFGMRPLYYHHAPQRCLVFASAAPAIVAHPAVPSKLNEGRILDALVPDLEWMDYTSTFYQQVYRLSAGHSILVDYRGIQTRQYWCLEPEGELTLSSKAEYIEAFLELFQEAVRCRLNTVGPTGSMLSGGLDSGSVVAVARRLLASSGSEPLHTFSGTGPDPVGCVESGAVALAMTMDSILPQAVCHDALFEAVPQIETVWSCLEEPFDCQMVMSMAVNELAARSGVRVMLDGGGGDVVLGHGSYPIRLIQQGEWTQGIHETLAEMRFYGAPNATAVLLSNVRAAYTPAWLRRAAQGLRRSLEVSSALKRSLVDRDFARTMAVHTRFKTMAATFGRNSVPPTYRVERAQSIQPNMVAARERYARVAALSGVEARDPFLDARLVRFCVALPGAQKLRDGWPKVLLRDAMQGLLPDGLRWRRGKEHLGCVFWGNLQTARGQAGHLSCAGLEEELGLYVDRAGLGRAWGQGLLDMPWEQRDTLHSLDGLATWLSRV